MRSDVKNKLVYPFYVQILGTPVGNIVVNDSLLYAKESVPTLDELENYFRKIFKDNDFELWADIRDPYQYLLNSFSNREVLVKLVPKEQTIDLIQRMD